MKLDRSDDTKSSGKYALINLRDIFKEYKRSERDIACAVKVNPELIEIGRTFTPNEFFVIKLKDKYAAAALWAYADAAAIDDPEYANEIRELATRAGPNSMFCKTPD